MTELTKEYFDQKLEGLARTTADGFVAVDKRFEAVDKRLEAIGKRLDTIDGKILQLPTKTDLDDKLSDLSGDLIVKLRKEDQKVNRLLEILKQKNLLSDGEIQELANFQIFPK